jgi:hypothetical protein
MFVLTTADAIEEFRHRHARARPGRMILAFFTGYLHSTWKPGYMIGGDDGEKRDEEHGLPRFSCPPCVQTRS